MRSAELLAGFTLVCGLAASVSLAETPQAPKAAAEAATPKPDGAVFTRLVDYLTASPIEFKTTFVKRSDTLGTSRGEARFKVRHPNLFRIEALNGRDNLIVISDGTTMTIYNPRSKKFAKVPAPRSAREGLGIITGLMSAQSQILTLIGVLGDVAAGRPQISVAATRAETIGGRTCDGYAIVDQTSDVTDRWHLWLEQRNPALPCKLESRSSDAIDDATQTNEFSWTESPTFGADAFTFAPPPGASEVSVGDLGIGPDE